MKFTVLVENMYLQEDALIESWIHESGGDARTMLQKFKDWVKSMFVKLANAVSTGYTKFMSMMKEIWARGVLLAKKIVGKLSNEEYEVDREKVMQYHKSIRDAASLTHEEVNDVADKIKAGEFKSIQAAFDAGQRQYKTELDDVFSVVR